MAQIFHRSTNTIARVSIFAAVFLVGGLLWAALEMSRSPYVTYAGVARMQPVPFSHEHHVGGLGIDCRYCHTSVETSAMAGLPPTHVCMTCHSQIWTGAPVLEPVRQSLATGRPIPWQRVARVPDYVYFNHSIHIDRGVPCVTCHGRVDQMPLMARAQPFQMGWCLDCHRNP